MMEETIRDPPDIVARFKASGIAWWATVTTVAEALAAEAAGASAASASATVVTVAHQAMPLALNRATISGG
jgi:NAD(P)H-dependent flavin oxidoreductase YrpB (nitropropane dioxygenase family)